jgi:predicted nucleotidyltransferase
MNIDFKVCTEEELWKYIATHLKQRGIDTVLVGGAVVSIYSDGAYKSGDLDFVLTQMFTKGIPEAMKEIGFEKKSTRHYAHPDCTQLYVEFPSSFLEIGNDSEIIPDEIEIEGLKIKILSPTDCVKDRLASYIHFNARECLDQAALVANQHPINLSEVKRWCFAEKGEKQWEDFFAKIKSIAEDKNK